MTLNDRNAVLWNKIVLRSPPGWKSWKLIARTISSAPSLFVAQRPSSYSHGNMGKFGETSGVGKSGVLEHIIGNISETRKDRGKVTMEGL